MLYYIVIAIILLPLSILLPIKKVGKKNLKELKGKHYIISCNHMSNWDPVMMDVKFNRKHRFLAKKELFKNKFAGACLKSFGAIPVDRSKPDPSSIKEVTIAITSLTWGNFLETKKLASPIIIGKKTNNTNTKEVIL